MFELLLTKAGVTAAGMLATWAVFIGLFAIPVYYFGAEKTVTLFVGLIIALIAVAAVQTRERPVKSAQL